LLIVLEDKLRGVRLLLQRQGREMTKRRSRGRKGGKLGLAVEDCEARRDCSVKQRDAILFGYNEWNVSAIEGEEMELGSGEGDLR